MATPRASSYAHDASKLRYLESTFTNDRGKTMFYCAFFPPTNPVPVRGVVLFLHGIGEHSHRFTHVYEHLCANHYGVISYDMIAHGRSDCELEGVRGHGEQFQHFVDDTNRFVSIAKDNVFPRMLQQAASSSQQQQREASVDNNTPPLIFMGISFGSLVGLHTILSGVHTFRAIVLASPAVSVEYTLVLRMMSVLSKSLSWLIPTAKIVPGVNFAGLCRDPAFVKDYMSDPLNVTDNLSARMGEQVMTAMEILSNDLRCEDVSSAFCALPLLIVQGTGDIVTSIPMARAFHARIASKDKEFKAFDGLFHCIFNEPEKQDVIDYITQWLDTRVASGDATAVKLLHSKL